MRRLLASAFLVACLVAAASGCGTSFKLPTESRVNRIVPGDKSYQLLKTFPLGKVADLLLLPAGTTDVFYVLYNQGGIGTTPRGELHLASLTTGGTIPGANFPNMFNPVAICSGGDGVGSSANRIYVLDQGDTVIARANPATGLTDSTGGWNLRISDLAHYWRVREYRLAGSDTITSFTDTSMAFVSGVAADASGNVYVSGLAIISLPNPNDIRLRERVFQFRIYKYARGPRYAGVTPPDRNIPGGAWHRDTTFVIDVGNGTGFINDPRAMFWSGAGGNSVYVADYGNNRAERLYDIGIDTGYYPIDGADSGQNFSLPEDVAVDASGFAYVADTGGGRVLRYDPFGVFVQRVDVEGSENGPLHAPFAIAADDSFVYVADRDPALVNSTMVTRYKRRS